MLLVKTYIAPSKIQGIGLFAGEDIKKGTFTWRYYPGVDSYLSVSELKKLPQLFRDYVEKYSALSPLTDKYILYGDDARFTNHSTNGNIEIKKDLERNELCGFAGRDISKDEELLVNYRLIDKKDAEGTDKYLDS